MSLWRSQTRGLSFPPAQDLIPRRSSKPGRAVTAETAMHLSAVWAAVRLRANLMSSFPVDVFRMRDGIQSEMPTKPRVLVTPSPRVTIREWLYSTQVDLDRYGNCFGLVRSRDGLGFPVEIELVPAESVTVVVRDGELAGYRIGGADYDVLDVWHEKQYTAPGLHVGLSPLAYAAWSLGEFASIQQFAVEWFDSGTMPGAVLKNTERHVGPDAANEVKARYKAAVQNGDIFVTGNDWDFSVVQSAAAGSQWLQAKQFGLGDIARFFDVPGDLIDAAVSGSSITYANLTQRNLQLLIMHLGPAVARREDALSNLLPRPQFVKLNTDALLRMDPKERSAMLVSEVTSKLRTPSEARALMNLAPLSPQQEAELRDPTAEELLALFLAGAISRDALLIRSGLSLADAPQAVKSVEPAAEKALDLAVAAPTLVQNPGLPALVDQLRQVLDGEPSQIDPAPEDGGTP